MPRKNGTISHVEIHPVIYFTEDGEEFAEVTTPEKAHAWSVYAVSGGMSEWVSDHRTKTVAMKKAKTIARRHMVPIRFRQS
jgi:ribosome biogenesis SPOUT family RNA methylase Rps3